MAGERVTSEGREYPYAEGDVIVLGPEIFASQDGKVICWRGQNYVLQGSSVPRQEYEAALRAETNRADQWEQAADDRADWLETVVDENTQLKSQKKEWEWALTALQGVKEATRQWANSSDPNRDVVLLRRLGPDFDAFDERGKPHSALSDQQYRHRWPYAWLADGDDQKKVPAASFRAVLESEVTTAIDVFDDTLQGDVIVTFRFSDPQDEQEGP